MTPKMLQAMTPDRARSHSRPAATGSRLADADTRPGLAAAALAAPAAAAACDGAGLAVNLLEAGGQRFALPTAAVIHQAGLGRAEADAVAARGLYRLDGLPVPVLRLTLLFGPLLRFPEPAGEPAVVVVATPGGRLALLVDRLSPPCLVRFQPRFEVPRATAWMSGSAITSAGERVAVLNPAELVRRHGSGGPGAAAGAAAEGERPALLIADDAAGTRQGLARLASDLGFRPLLARNGFEALELLSTLPAAPALLVFEAELSGIGAGELISLLQAQGALRRAPVLLLTSVDGDVQSMAELGASACLLRPFRLHTAAAVIRLLAGCGEPDPDDGHDPGR